MASTKERLPAALTSYVAVQTEGTARELERYFKSGSGKAFANKRLWESPQGNRIWDLWVLSACDDG